MKEETKQFCAAHLLEWVYTVSTVNSMQHKQREHGLTRFKRYIA